MGKQPAVCKKLFWQDPYMSRFQARVLEVDARKVVLDQTCFYPQGGGQLGDTGRIQEIGVIDTQGDGKTILHLLEREPNFGIGEQVSCQLNWERRYRIMKLHSASHVVEHFLFEVFGGLVLVGTYVSERNEKSTYQLEGVLDPNRLQEVADLVNRFLSRNLDIKVFGAPDDPDHRLWECGEIRIPCGGTHPSNTREIGQVRIRRKSGGRDQEMVITTLCEP